MALLAFITGTFAARGILSWSAKGLSRLVAAGLTPYQALRGGTRAAAEFVHAEKEFRTVAPGLRADLLLLDANPLSDVRNVRQRAGVMVRGRWFSEAKLRQKLAALAAEAAAGK